MLVICDPMCGVLVLPEVRELYAGGSSLVVFIVNFISKLQRIPGGWFWPGDKSITEY